MTFMPRVKKWLVWDYLESVVRLSDVVCAP